MVATTIENHPSEEDMRQKDKSTISRTYTIDEAAKLAGIGRNLMYEAAARGEVPTIRLGKRILVPKIPFDRMLEHGGKAA
jgi:excisionase family DNA binding protein